ncbi:MAG: bifunctional acetate--CoA ligase family protein/GNAT family N-acetyltransferase [Burkholderiales bacterium]|nr:bifunctional acetate--CoA ligase family protein/GNAT family N-acetyltransferase [Anaerolineae bacterium]
MQDNSASTVSSANAQFEPQPLSTQYASLNAIFAPNNVAVIGATEKEGSVGRTILWNLVTNPFGGTVFPVNPKRSNVLGIRAYPNIAAVPEHVDLAVIVTPAQTVPGIIGECIAAGVKGAIVISAGFKEIGPAGAELERQILEQARQAKMRIIGPNCLGVMMPRRGLNATFAGAMARPGNVAFISQSGALCTSVLDWSFSENVGFSAFMSIGSMLDVGWGDLINYLGDDPHTESIVIYMESVGDARSFISAAREVAKNKPIIVIKAGRTEAAAHAAASHTGTLAGSDDVLDMAFRRCGVLRVNRIADLFFTAEVLAKQPRPKGNRLTILTNAGGPGVLATDALITEGGQLAELAPETIAALNELLPPHWSHGNPIDILGDADPMRYAKSLEIAAKDPNSDGLLVILTPQAMTDPTQTAEFLKPYAKIEGKPVLASWMGEAAVAAGEAILNRANIPTLTYPDTATRLFNYMWQYSSNLRALYETPAASEDPEHEPDRAAVSAIIKAAQESGRVILTEVESKQVLAAYGIPTSPIFVALNIDDAVKFAEQIGYPVVVKIHSETITHKTDVGGVVLNLRSDDEVRTAYERIQQTVSERVGPEHFLGVTVQRMEKLDGYELIIGTSLDAQFGPVLLFGTGGTLVEVFKDRALALPPLNTTLAKRMMERTKIFEALKGVRGRDPVDLDALAQLMTHFSQLVVEQPWIKEIDINPLLASPERLLALDGRVVLHPSDTPESQLPRPAIRPYPNQYVKPFSMKDGTEVLIRPVRPEDEPSMVHFQEGLSDRTVRMRYFQPLNLSQRTSHEYMTRLCFIDYDREMVLVSETSEAEIVSAARLSKLQGSDDGEFAIIVADDYQRRGLGTELIRRLIEVGRDEGIRRIVGLVLADNADIQRVLERVGFKIEQRYDNGTMRVALSL